MFANKYFKGKVSFLFCNLPYRGKDRESNHGMGKRFAPKFFTFPSPRPVNMNSR